MAPNPKAHVATGVNAVRFETHPVTPPPTFPTTALGPILSAAAIAVAARTQAPPVLAAHHLLTLAAMAAQRLVGVRLPTGALRPVSCYLATLVGAGEGRGALVKAIVDPLRDPPADLAAAAAARRLGLFAEPRRPGTLDRYRSFRYQSALFANRSDDVVASGRARRVEAASLAALWDGRVEPGSAMSKPYHPRLSLHLVAAPRDGFDLLGDPDLADAGLLGRLLVAAPPSRVGERVWAPGVNDDLPSELAAVHARVNALARCEPTAPTRAVTFTASAARQWLSFAQEMEAAMREEGAFAAIRPLAGRLAEQAARLAAVIALMEDGALAELDDIALARGLMLARFYAAEALRLADLAPVIEPAPEAAERLRHWLERTHDGRGITLRDVCRLGPASSRDADVAYRLMRRLERLGFIQPKTASTEGAGRSRRVREPYCWVVRAHATTTSAVMSQDVA